MMLALSLPLIVSIIPNEMSVALISKPAVIGSSKNSQNWEVPLNFMLFAKKANTYY